MLVVKVVVVNMVFLGGFVVFDVVIIRVMLLLICLFICKVFSKDLCWVGIVINVGLLLFSICCRVGSSSVVVELVGMCSVCRMVMCVFCGCGCY